MLPAPIRAEEDPRRAGYHERSVNTSRVNEQYPVMVRNTRLRTADLERLRKEVLEFGYRPLVSIITLVGDFEQTALSDTVNSMLSQIYADWELLLVRDSVKERRLLTRYAHLDRRIKAIPQPDGTASEALNAALSRSSGEFVGFLDPGDELSVNALFEVVKLLQERPEAEFIYTDEDELDRSGRRCNPHFKPDWSPDLHLSTYYTSRLSVYRRSLLEEIGGFEKDFEEGRDYDLTLRFTEQTSEIHHVPKVLYHRKQKTAGSLDSREAGRALSEALERRGLEGSVEDGASSGYFRVRFEVVGEPKVSILIPTRDNVALLKRCIESVECLTTYPNYEILILDNESTDPETVEYLASTRHRVVSCEGAFNYSKINNQGVSESEGEYVLLLNNDTEVISGGWLEEMLRHAQRAETGAVGAKLLYPTGFIQHAGVLTGVGSPWGPGVATHSHPHYPADSPGYMNALNTVRNYSAVTAACMMIRKSVFLEVDGFDEVNLQRGFNDVDLCLRMRERGYFVVYTPYAELYHHESASRGRNTNPAELSYMRKRWGESLDRDPYYNSNFSFGDGSFNLRADLLRPKTLRMDPQEDLEVPGTFLWEMSNEERKSHVEIRLRNVRGSRRTTLAPTEKSAESASETSRPISLPSANHEHVQTINNGSSAQQLVWIFGSARTGSTWLSSMMSALENQVRWNEPYVGMLFGHFLYDRLEGKTKLLDSPAFIMGGPHRTAWLKSIKNFVLEGASARYPDLTEDQFLIVKEPNGSLGAPIIMEAMPESRMIFLIRDSRDVVASRLDAFKKGSWSAQDRDYSSSEALNQFTKHLAEDYLKVVSKVWKAFDSHPGEKAMVRYEDLRADPLGTLLNMYDSLNMAVDKTSLEAAITEYDWERIPEGRKGTGKFYRKARPGSWEEDLSAEQIRLVEDITAPVLSEYYGFDAAQFRLSAKPESGA